MGGADILAAEQKLCGKQVMTNKGSSLFAGLEAGASTLQSTAISNAVSVLIDWLHCGSCRAASAGRLPWGASIPYTLSR
jgi:hypothetical protein